MARLAWGELPARLATCSGCQKAFSAGDPYFSELKGDHARGYLRADFCVDCWTANETPGKKRHTAIKGSWRAQLPHKERSAAVQAPWTERGLEWLKEELKKEGPDKPAVYVLAMLLVREKVLTLRQEIQGLGQERLQLYEVAETEELLAVPKLEAAQLSLEAIQERLRGLLDTSHA